MQKVFKQKKDFNCINKILAALLLAIILLTVACSSKVDRITLTKENSTGEIVSPNISITKEITQHSQAAKIENETLSPVSPLNLSRFPYPFVKEGQYNDFILVVGDDAPKEDVFASVQILIAIQNATHNQTPLGKNIAMLTSEVSDPYLKNIITVGHPCVNYITKLFLNYTLSCDNTSNIEFAEIKYVKISDNKVGLLVYGSSANATLKASSILYNHTFWQEKGLLKGPEVILKKSDFENISTLGRMRVWVVSEINETPRSYLIG